MSKLESWGKYPYYPQNPHQIYWQDEILGKITEVCSEHKSTLPFGNGRSYGDVCLAESDNVIQLKNLAKFIDFDEKNGIIKVESGVTIEEILKVTIPKGWFVAVTPGTKYVTVGGAIANDVHGKNHHEKGTFGCNVTKFGLIRSDQEKEIICSKDENQELFNATIGGLGLTGIISFAELKLIKITSSIIETKVMPFKSLDEFFEISKENDTKYDYTVSWVDCLSKGDSLGRGIYFAGNHSEKGVLKIANKKKTCMPFLPPFSLINKFSLKLFNSFYYNLHLRKREVKSTYDEFFYPLDHVEKWNRIYGKKGFQQYQCVIPKDGDGAEAGIREILKMISKAKSGSFLAVLKNFGDFESPGLLSFPVAGTSLALDFAQGKYLAGLFDDLDKIVVKFGGRIYPAKDAHMSGENFRKLYPKWQKLEELRDKSLNSRFWNRVINDK